MTDIAERLGETASIFVVRISDRTTMNIAVKSGLETRRFYAAFPDAVPHNTVWVADDPVATVMRQRERHSKRASSTKPVMPQKQVEARDKIAQFLKNRDMALGESDEASDGEREESANQIIDIVKDYPGEISPQIQGERD